jgi:hypothetical protein
MRDTEDGMLLMSLWAYQLQLLAICSWAVVFFALHVNIVNICLCEENCWYTALDTQLVFQNMKMNFANTSFYTGRPYSWYIKYSVTSMQVHSVAYAQ